MKGLSTAAGVAVMLASVLGGPAEARAQDSTRAELSRWIYPGSDAENYLRYLQTLGLVQEYPWSLRGFSPTELRMLSPHSNEHPWAHARSIVDRSRSFRGVTVGVAPIAANWWYNTSFPFGMNDGAVWAGRGLTAELKAGVFMSAGPVDIVLAPTGFWTENRDFDLLPVAGAGVSSFADGLNPTTIDRPQRFGSNSYGRVDAGQSTLRLNLPGLALGVSSANEWWGPMQEFPFVLGNNAPGFGHVFLGTSRPLNVFVGRLHTRVIYGRLEQSAFSPSPPDSARRFAEGIVATFQPRGFPGLEVGAARFFHVPWPDSGLTRDYFTHLFETFLKARITKRFLVPGTGDNADNQLASAFARWVMPHSGFELYGEFGREDHNVDARDFMVEPDHTATYGVGVRKAWQSGVSLKAIRAEIMNFESSTLQRHRLSDATFVHSYTRQGHTHRGQLLAAGFAAGNGAAATVSVEQFRGSSGWRASWSRLAVGERTTSAAYDVQHVLRIERGSSLRAGAFTLRVAADWVYEFNRQFGADQSNFRVVVGSSWYP
jgi:hypothetical protein